jgi:cell wall-associated NlpC family hydrolase
VKAGNAVDDATQIDAVAAWWATRSSRILRDDEEQARKDIVRIAKTWVGTPYILRARLKSHGADCLTFVIGVFEEAGVIDKIPDKMLPYYSPQRHLTPGALITDTAVRLYLKEVAKPPARVPKPGDVVMFPAGKDLVHCGLVIDWPSCMHCYRTGGGVQGADYNMAPNKYQREARMFSAWD